MPGSWLENIFKKSTSTEPGSAYNLWAGAYDEQPGNLMLDLDELIFSELLARTCVRGKTVVDIGCGTGRHWKKILDLQPNRLVGYDLSEKMLEKLIQKFPEAEVYQSKSYLLPELENGSADLVVSTLTIAHIKKMELAFTEWARIVKTGGELILTDYHPDALVKGAKRSFLFDGKTVLIKNYVHPTSKIRSVARKLGFDETRFFEKHIDDSVKSYYENQNALALYEQFKNIPIIYGIHLKKDS